MSFTVANTGAVAGKEVPQLYLAFPASADEPPQVLRSFSVVALDAGAQSRVAFTLDARAYSTWDVDAYAWAPARGEFGVNVGASSRDVRLRGTFTV